MIASTAKGIRSYQDHVGDKWTPLITEIYQRGRQRWRYLVPQDRSERSLLLDLCTRMLDLERHYLDVYADHLFGMKQGSDHDSAHASRMLKRIGRV